MTEPATPQDAPTAAAPAAAEDAVELPTRLLDREPFDRITLDAANDSAVIETEPLDLAGRQVPSPLPKEGSLRLRRVGQPSISYTLDWTAIARIELYEQMLLAEAHRLAAAGNLGDAFDYLAYLRTNYPDVPGLEQALQSYLWKDATAAFSAGNGDGAWPSLAALYQRNPDFPRLAVAVQAVSDGLIRRHVADNDFAAARAVLELVERHFSKLDLPNVPQWRDQLARQAELQLAAARAALAAGNYEDARRAAMSADAILPSDREANALLEQIHAAAPEFRIGVTQFGAAPPCLTVPAWADARVAPLVDPQLVEMTAFGAEGGAYGSHYGELHTDAAGLRTTLRLTPAGLRQGVTPDGVIRRLAREASVHGSCHRADLAARLQGMRIVDGVAVEVAWRWPHLHPEAFLQIPLPQIPDGAGNPGVWIAASPTRAATERRYERARNAEAATAAPRYVVEQLFGDDETALAALAEGDVDAIDRVPPWHFEQVRRMADVELTPYRLPTVHVLVPNLDRPLLQLREFRRALCYGIDRDAILKEIILGGQTKPGFQTLSGPFPAGTSLNDPAGYATDPNLAPRPYEPKLASLLANVARATLAKRESARTKPGAPAAANSGDGDQRGAAPDDALPALVPLVLAHPADPIARVSCESIKVQLAHIGVPVKLVEFSASQPHAIEDCDLLYLELAVQEPLVDARRLFGADGATGRAGPMVKAALDKLDLAQNWNDARQRLWEIHRLTHVDLPVIPLWQTVNFFARRTWLAGVGDSPITLYQNLAVWRKTFDDAGT